MDGLHVFLLSEKTLEVRTSVVFRKGIWTEFEFELISQTTGFRDWNRGTEMKCDSDSFSCKSCHSPSAWRKTTDASWGNYSWILTTNVDVNDVWCVRWLLVCVNGRCIELLTWWVISLWGMIIEDEQNRNANFWFFLFFFYLFDFDPCFQLWVWNDMDSCLLIITLLPSTTSGKPIERGLFIIVENRGKFKIKYRTTLQKKEGAAFFKREYSRILLERSNVSLYTAAFVPSQGNRMVSEKNRNFK